MADLIQTSKCIPCPICADIAGKCRIDEYGYIALCYSQLDAKVGDLIKTWLCRRVHSEFSQWKDQRVALETLCQEVEIKFFDANQQPLESSTIADRIFDDFFKKHGSTHL
jgi:hypothetical protein